MNFQFFFNSILLGVGLAMDAFSVSLANGLNEPCMKRPRMCGIAGIFAFFQGLMPLIGWVCIHTILEYFESFEKVIPYIALVLLCYIGGKMLYDGLTSKCEDGKCESVSFWGLIVQGVATSIDALSVGFDIAEYDLPRALLAALIIAAITFAICLGGLYLGKRGGTKLAGKASIFGGAILILIGLEIFIVSFIG